VATAEDVAMTAGIDLTDKEFWRGALQMIARQIDLFCDLVKE
jgi:oligoendopeptidase F